VSAQSLATLRVAQPAGVAIFTVLVQALAAG
jgi:hypothetical protein